MTDEHQDPQPPREENTMIRTGNRACPVCAKHMDVQSHHGHEVDVCGEHGVWLDSGELSGIIDRIRKYQQNIDKYRIERAYQEGKRRGIAYAFLPFMALLDEEL